MQPLPPSMSRTFLSSPTETLYPLNNNSSFPPPPNPWQPLCTFYLYEFDYFRYLVYVESYNICPFVAYFTYHVFGVHPCYGMNQKFLPFYKTVIQKDTRTPMFIAALFTIAKKWKQPRCPSIDERIKKM